ncbi:MAG: DUF2062 domain-containing protein [Nitrospirae bacterium]|nr:DUF2062 domain-containing protein [Nitrospirota bacterium]
MIPSKIKEKLRKFYHQIIDIDDTPEKIALGMAIGIALGILPTFGIGTFLAIGLAFLLRANRLSAILGTFIMNPWVAPFFWMLSYAIGGLFLGKGWSNIQAEWELYKNNAKSLGELIGKDILLPYIIGNVILTVILAITGYIITLKLVRIYRETKKRYPVQRKN